MSSFPLQPTVALGREVTGMTLPVGLGVEFERPERSFQFLELGVPRKAEVGSVLLRGSAPGVPGQQNRARSLPPPPNDQDLTWVPATSSCLACGCSSIEFKLGTGAPDTPQPLLFVLGAQLCLLCPIACVTPPPPQGGILGFT